MAKKTVQQASAPEQNLNKQEAIFIKYRKQITCAVIAAIVIIAGIVIYKNFFSAPREDKAATALAKAQDAFAQENYAVALNGDKTFEGFIAISENYGGTDAANLARAYAGICYAKTGKWAEAVKYLEDFSTQDDALISPAVTAALGNAYANTGDVDKAIKTLQKAADMANSEAPEGISNSLAPSFLIQAARLLESQNKNDEALKIYQTIKEKYVNSPASQDIDKYIERLSNK